MKKLFIGILLFPVLIFAVGLIFVFIGKSLNFISPSKPDSRTSEDRAAPVTEKSGTHATTSPAPKQILKPSIQYADTQYYNVTGFTRNEIRASMTQAKKGTFLEGHDAVTTAEMNINFSRKQLAGKCETVMTQFDLIITYTYPKWTLSQNAPSDLVAKWNSFIAALTVHEEGHVKIETERATVVMEELQKIPTYPTCEEFDQAWQTKADTLDLETKQIEAKYDQDTKSGRLQGVIF